MKVYGIFSSHTETGDLTSVPQSYPVIEFSIADLEVHHIRAEALRALTATVGALKMYLFSSGIRIVFCGILIRNNL